MNLMEQAAARSLGIDPPRKEPRVRRRVLATSGNLVLGGVALSWEDGTDEQVFDTKVSVGVGTADEREHVLKRRARYFDIDLYLSDALRLDRSAESMSESEFAMVQTHLARSIREWVEGVPPDQDPRPFDEYPGSWEASVRHVLGRDASAVLESVDLDKPSVEGSKTLDKKRG